MGAWGRKTPGGPPANRPSTGPNGEPPTDGDLALLLEREAELRERVESARAKAEDAVRRAEVEIQAEDARLESDLERELRELEGRLTDEFSRERDRLRERMGNRTARYRSVEPEQVRRAAGTVLPLLVEPEDPR